VKPGWPINVTGWPMAAAEAPALAVATCGSSLKIPDDATDGRTCGAAGNISRWVVTGCSCDAELAVRPVCQHIIRSAIAGATICSNAWKRRGQFSKETICKRADK